MEITWHDDTNFTIRDKGVSLALNPDRKAGKLKADIVLSSSEDDGAIEGIERIFDWPGEYEMKDVPIVAMQAWTKSKSSEDKNGPGDKTLIFCFDIGGVKFCHLGELGHVPTSEMFNEIGDVDVLMIKVGEGANLDSKKGMEVIEGIEPKVVIPMGKDLSAAVLKSLGADKVEAIDKFEIKAVSDLPADQMKYIVLNRT